MVRRIGSSLDSRTRMWASIGLWSSGLAMIGGVCEDELAAVFGATSLRRRFDTHDSGRVLNDI